MFQEEKMILYLEFFRDEKYQLLSESLKNENASTIIAFCDYLVRYEGVHHLNFLRQLTQ
jgi:hypothetical protein